jgi:hypothetical protein
VRALSKATVAGVVRPPSDDPELQDPDAWSQQLDDQKARFETRFKAQAVNGAESTPESPYESLTQEVLDRAENERVASGDDEKLWPGVRHRQLDNPHSTLAPSACGLSKAARNSRNFFLSTNGHVVI